MKFSEYVEELKKKGVHPRVIAKQCKISISTLHRYVSGRGRPTLEKAVKISKITEGKVSVAELRENE